MANKTMVSSFSKYCTTGCTVIKENETDIMNMFVQMLQKQKSNDVITLADFGTADGGNVLPLMNTLIGCIQRMNSKDQHINILFEDQCLNDFNALVQTVAGIRGNNSLQTNGTVHVLYSSTSMYQQCLPDASLDFGVSVYSVHWASQWSVKFKNGIFAFDADSDQLTILKEQAKVDWRNFIYSRGKELKRGGFFSVSTLMAGMTDIYNAITNVYKELVKDGVITEKEFENTNIESYYERSEDDIRFPFMDEADTELSNLGLKLVSLKLIEREFWPFNTTESNADDNVRRIENITSVIEGWLRRSLYSGLSGERTTGERDAIIVNFFQRLKKKISLDGPKFQYINPMADIMFQKQ